MMTTLQNQDFVKSAKSGTGMVRLDLEMIMFLPRTSCIVETGRCINALIKSSIAKIHASKQSAPGITPKM